jgi:hypothetical protein
MTILDELKEINYTPFDSSLRHKYFTLKKAMREYFETNDNDLLIEIKRFIS